MNSEGDPPINLTALVGIIKVRQSSESSGIWGQLGSTSSPELSIVVMFIMYYTIGHLISYVEYGEASITYFAVDNWLDLLVFIYNLS